MSFAKVLRTLFDIEHLWWLLLSLVLVSFIQKQSTIKRLSFTSSSNYISLLSALYSCISKSFPGPSIILLLISYLDCCLHISLNNEKKSKTKQNKKSISQNKHINFSHIVLEQPFFPKMYFFSHSI